MSNEETGIYQGEEGTISWAALGEQEPQLGGNQCDMEEGMMRCSEKGWQNSEESKAGMVQYFFLKKGGLRSTAIWLRLLWNVIGGCDTGIVDILEDKHVFSLINRCFVYIAFTSYSDYDISKRCVM